MSQETQKAAFPICFEIRFAQVVSSCLVILGILAMLRTGWGRVADPVGIGLFGYPAHFLTGALQVSAGLVGIACAVRRDWTRPYLTGTAVLFAAWAVACVALDGRPSDVVAGDGVLIAVLLAVSVSSAAVVLATRERPARAHATAGEA